MIKRIDILSRQNIMRLKGYTSFKSNFGAILTTIYLILCVLAFIAFGGDIFYKSNPSIVFSNQYNNDTIFNWHEDMVMFNLQTDNKIFSLDEVNKIFEIRVYYSDNNASLIDQGKQYVRTEYKPINCVNIPILMQERLAGGLDTYFCLPEEFRNRPIRKPYGDGNSKVGIIHVYRCKNSTINNNTCYSDEKINSFIGQRFFLHIIKSVSVQRLAHSKHL